MCIFRSTLLGISLASALVRSPDILLISPLQKNSSNVSKLSKVIQGPWHTSDVPDLPLMSTNLTNSSTVRANRQIEWRCNDMLGTGPYATSCDDAIHDMAFTPPGSDDSHEFRWGRREFPLVRDIPLPQEVVSSDGHCRTNVHLRDISSWNVARASQSQVKAGVSAVIDNCMRNQAQPLGGVARNINDDGFLEVWVFTSEEPPAATCYGRMRPNAEASCKWVLDQMPADSAEQRSFGPGSDPEAEVRLPWRLESPDRRCALAVKTAGPSDTSVWSILWQGAVELASLCARQGLQGREVRLGENHYLAMFLTDPSNDDTILS